MEIPEHPEIARCMATGYPHICKPTQKVDCCDCGKTMEFDDSFDWDGDIICAGCLKGRIEENFNIEDIAKLIGVRRPIQVLE